jgi:hypothetical protein
MASSLSPRDALQKKSKIESIDCYRSRRVIACSKHTLDDVGAVTITIVV